MRKHHYVRGGADVDAIEAEVRDRWGSFGSGELAELCMAHRNPWLVTIVSASPYAHDAYRVEGYADEATARGRFAELAEDFTPEAWVVGDGLDLTLWHGGEAVEAIGLR